MYVSVCTAGEAVEYNVPFCPLDDTRNILGCAGLLEYVSPADHMLAAGTTLHHMLAAGTALQGLA